MTALSADRQDRLERAIARSAKRFSRIASAQHAWMGQPLASYPEAELREILAALEVVAFDEVRQARRIASCDLCEAIVELDTALERAVRRP